MVNGCDVSSGVEDGGCGGRGVAGETESERGKGEGGVGLKRRSLV